MTTTGSEIQLICGDKVGAQVWLALDDRRALVSELSGCGGEHFIDRQQPWPIRGGSPPCSCTRTIWLSSPTGTTFATASRCRKYGAHRDVQRALQTGSDRVLRKRWILLLGWQDCVFRLWRPGPQAPATCGKRPDGTMGELGLEGRPAIRCSYQKTRRASVHPDSTAKRGLHQDCRAVCNAPALIGVCRADRESPHLRVMSISQSPTIPNPTRNLFPRL